jgi:hypothetical protein
MNNTARITVALVAAFGLANVAGATCRKVQVCDDYGSNCHAQDVCDSSLDLPSIDLAPLPPLPSTTLKPLPSMELPPLGTSHCEYKQVNGEWENICS